jgi:RNA polymerase sigma-70 factor (ECF subfamily)
MSKDIVHFDEIYSAFYKKSFLYVKSYIHNDAAAEDIVIEALILLWIELKKKEISPIAPFLFTILKNKSLDWLKQLAIRQNAHDSIHQILDKELTLRISSLEASDPKIVFSNEVMNILHETLDSLSEKTRDIFIMNRFENKSYKEIADIYNVSVKGVEYHITQAIKALRVSLKDYLPMLVFLLG